MRKENSNSALVVVCVDASKNKPCDKNTNKSSKPSVMCETCLDALNAHWVAGERDAFQNDAIRVGAVDTTCGRERQRWALTWWNCRVHFLSLEDSHWTRGVSNREVH